MSMELFEIKLKDVIEETVDSRSFVLDIPAEHEARFAYEAGQFLTFEIPWEDFHIRRCYSLSSAPGVDDAPKVTVKRVDGGRMSNWMIDNLSAGSVVKVQAPEGRFVVNPESGDDVPLTLLGAGSGVTPVISLLKSTLATTKRSVVLIYANRDADSVIFKSELKALAEKYAGRLTIHHHLDSEGGFLAAAPLKAMLAGRDAGEFYVCGPAPFMDLAEAVFKDAGVPDHHTHFERFVSPLDSDRREANAIDVAPEEQPESFILRLDGKKTTVPYVPGETLLACALKVDIKAPHSCEDGFCGCCMAQLVTGDLKMRSPEALSEHDIENGRVLLCQSIPTSTELLAVDYDAASFSAVGDRGMSNSPSKIAIAVVMAVAAAFIFVLRSLH